jgi:hypothetical protein
MLGQYNKAEAKLKEAIGRDPELATTANVYLAVVANATGRKEQSIAYVQSAIDGNPQGNLGRRLQADMNQIKLADAPTQRRWRLTVSTGMGWSDNVPAIDDDLPFVPAGITKTSGWFWRNTAHAAFDLLRDETHILTAGYAFQADTFVDDAFDAQDYLNHYGYLDYHRKLNDKLAAGIRVSDDYSEFSDSPFRNRFEVSPGITYQPADRIAFDLNYTYRSDEYLTPTTIVLDRDADAHVLGGAVHYQFKDYPVRSEFGFEFTNNNADGNDYDYEQITVYARGEVKLPWSVTGEATYAYTRTDYDNNNSLVFFGNPRNDDTHFVSLQLAKPVAIHHLVRARVYVRYEYVSNQSNIQVFAYDQNVISGGLVIDF